MGAASHTKRKTRRGKRGGETNSKKSDAADGSTETTNGSTASIALAAPTQDDSGVYVPPPMDTGDSLFYIDKEGEGEGNIDDQNERFNPASYGLVNPDLQHYLKGCEGMLDSMEFETPEDQEIFITNVYTEARNFELQLTTDHECSRILEKLLKISSDWQVRRILGLARKDMIRLIIHRFSSHVIQTILLLAAPALEREAHGEKSMPPDDTFEDESGMSFEEIVLEMAEAVKQNWVFLMTNEFASHVLRVLLLVLSGGPIEDPTKPKGNIKSKRSQKYMEAQDAQPVRNSAALARARTVPDSFLPALTELLAFASGAMNEMVVRGFVSHPVGSPMLQLMIELQAKHTKGAEAPGSLLDKALMGLLSDGESASATGNGRRDSYMRTMTTDTVGSHFIEKAMQLVSAPLFQQLYVTYFRGNLNELCANGVANFVVQSLLSNAKSTAQLELMIEEVGPEFGTLVSTNRPGVIRALVDSCARLDSGHAKVIGWLYKGLGVAGSKDGSKELINLLAFLIKYDDFIRRDYYRIPFKLQGTLIIQSMLNFKTTSAIHVIIDSYFAQDAEKIYSWNKDPSGSRVVEAIIKSPHVPMKSKRKLVRRFLGKYSDLAVDKYGSHIVDACWQVSDLQFKETILAELIQNETQVLDSVFGRLVWRNCKVDQYKRKANEWREREVGNERKKSMFKDILGDKLVVNSDSSGGDGALGSLGFSKAAPASGAGLAGAAKRGYVPDEIDSLFKHRPKPTAGSSARAKAKEAGSDAGSSAAVKVDSSDKSLSAVFDAISGTKKRKKNKKKHGDAGDGLEAEKPRKKSKKDKEKDRKKRRQFV